MSSSQRRGSIGWLAVALIVALPWWLGCGGQPAESDNGGNGATADQTRQAPDDDHHHEHGHHHDHHHHHHDPMFGGALHPLGDHFAHLEVVLDAEAGELTVYVLDGHVEAPIKIADERMVVVVESAEPALTAPLRLTLIPRESIAGDERVGHASRFAARHDHLAGVRAFRGRVAEPITVRGQTFADVPLRYPEGTEDDRGDHGHGDHGHDAHDHGDDHRHSHNGGDGHDRGHDHGHED